jgi:serine phosphatase RsbU (regulator of sigma subunit)
MDDLDILTTVAVELSFAVENSILHEVALREKAMQLELRVASQVQIGLLPSGPPELTGYEFFDYYSPARIVGGDYYDYLATETRRLAVVLGDVAGKGIPAALLMAKVSSELGVLLASGLSPVEVMQRVNSRMEKRSPEGAFVTMVLAMLDPMSHEITLVNAGHMPPLKRRSDGSVSEVGAPESGLPLGVDPDYEYTEVRISLSAGDSLILYSDGVIDAQNRASKHYGGERLQKVLLSSLPSVTSIGQSIIDDIHKFVGDVQQFDDICLLCFGRTPDH